MQVGQAQFVERLHDVGVERHRIGLAGIIGDAVGRETDRDAVRPPDVDRGLGHLEQQPRTVLDRATILIGALVAARLQELLQQIAIGAVDLDPVEACGERVFRTLPERFHDALDLLGLQRARRLVVGDLAVGGHRLHALGPDRDGRSRNRQSAAVEGRMRDAADMPELEKDDAALGVHGIRHLAPACDLRLRIDAWCRRVAAAVREHRRGFGNQQAAFGRTLAVIFGVERPRRKALALGPHARQRRHRDAMRKLVGSDLQRLKQRLEFHVVPGCL